MAQKKLKKGGLLLSFCLTSKIEEKRLKQYSQLLAYLITCQEEWNDFEQNYYSPGQEFWSVYNYRLDKQLLALLSCDKQNFLLDRNKSIEHMFQHPLNINSQWQKVVDGLKYEDVYLWALSNTGKTFYRYLLQFD